MKKIISLFVVAVIALATLCGCGSVDVKGLNPLDYITLGDYETYSIDELTEMYDKERETFTSSYNSFNLDWGYTVEMNLICELVSGDDSSTTYTRYEKYCYTGDNTLTLNIYENTADAYRTTFDSALVYDLNAVGEDSVSAGDRTVKIGTAFDFTYKLPYMADDPELSGKTLRFTVTPVKVLAPLYTDTDIENDLDKFFEENSAERSSAEAGDMITADITAKLDGEKLSAMSYKDRTFILGCSEYPSEFDSSVAGTAVGQTATFDVTYPDDWTNENFAGKTVSFEVKVKSSVSYDKTVAEKTSYASLYELKEALRVEYFVKYGIMNVVYDRSTLNTIPEKLYNEYYNHSKTSIKNDLKEQADYYTSLGNKTTVSDLISYYWGSNDEFEKYVGDLAKENVLATLVCYALLDELDIEYTEEDYKNDLKKNASVYNGTYGTSYSVSEFEKLFNKNILKIVFLEEVIGDVLYKNVDGYPIFDFKK